MQIDLHLHTSASDGTSDPKELVEEIVEKGIGIFAVTDHDTTVNVEKTFAFAKEQGLGFISAAEISAVYDGKIFHILAYGCDIGNRQLKEVLQYNQTVWANIDISRIEWVSRKDRRVNAQEFFSYSYEPSRGGWSSLNYLIDKGIVGNMQEYFMTQTDFVMDENFAYLPDVIEAINASGGKAFLAHPAYSKEKNERVMSADRLDKLVRAGIVGIECYTIYNASKEEEKYYLTYAQEKGLLISGGSDYHGKFITQRKLGVPHITTEMLHGTWYEEMIR